MGPTSFECAGTLCRSWARAVLLILSLVLGLQASSCGSNDEETASDETFVQTSELEKEFALAGNTHNVPARFLLAVAFLESHLAEKPTRADYQGVKIGPSNGETAFGLSRATLALPAEGDVDLQTQSHAYAKYLFSNVDVLLVKNPQTNEEKMQWIFEIARLHRKTSDTQALFARELVSLFNHGFVWYDARRHQYVQFAPESPKINTAELSQASQSLLAIDLKSAIKSSQARALVMPVRTASEVVQEPSGIELVHCPFSLSACLDLQIEGSTHQNFALGAHYIVPQNNELVDYPIQVALHGANLPYTGRDGKLAASSGKIRIMLVGYSGRLHKGKRQLVSSDWLSKWQLQTMGLLITDICSFIGAKPPSSLTPVTSCATLGQGLTVFAHQKGNPYAWGQIYDYDEQIFARYLGTTERQLEDTSLRVGEQGSYVNAGQVIALNLGFNQRALNIELNRLVRCPDGSVRWSNIERSEVQGETSYQFYNKRYWDGGVNNTGEQFFRAKVFGPDKEFLGWDITKLAVKNFVQGYVPIPPDECSE